jgi:Putative zinc-finger
MTFTHDDIRERLIDFLYGELDGDARAAFDAHIGACDRCRFEVKAFEQTRAAARAVVRAPLEGASPPDVRARIMEAATRAATERAAAGQVLEHAGPAAAVTSRPRWTAWLRARWTLPMFATVAAMGALLLVRETIFREARQPLGETPSGELSPQTGSPVPAATPAPTTDKSRERGPGRDRERDRDREHDRDRDHERERDRDREHGSAVPGPHVGPAQSLAPSTGEAAVDRSASSAGANAQAVSPSRRRKSASDPFDGVRTAKAKADAFGFGGGAMGLSPSKRGLDEVSGAGRRGDGAGIGGGTAGLVAGNKKGQTEKSDEAVDKAAEKARPFRPKAASNDDLLEGSLNRAPDRDRGKREEESAASADVAASQAAPSARASAASSSKPVVAAADRAVAEFAKAPAPSSPRKIPTPSPAAPAATAPSPAPSVPPPGADAKVPQDPAVPLFDRAEKLMAAGRWNQAAAVYRDLLQRFPRHVSVPIWRRRLAAAQAGGQQIPDNSGFAAPPPAR